MTCFHPLEGWVGKRNPVTGKCPTVFHRRLSPFQERRDVPCGQCIGCRMRRSGDWAVRVVHEASLYEKNSFVTLTYNDQNLPKDGSLHYRDFQLFLKRLRKHFGTTIRFYMCGEYGENFGRPHYHVILFNCDFPDKKIWRRTKSGCTQYRSAILEKLWPLGNCEIGSVTFQSAAYVARYIHKKVTGDQAAFHYCDIDPYTGEVLSEVKAEFSHMSLKPGIGKAWFDKYHATDVAPHDSVVINGREMRPPRYYDLNFELLYPEEAKLLKKKREASCNAEDRSPRRLLVREHVAQARLAKLVRTLK